MKLCSTCVLSDKVPNISFDESGTCSYCRDHRHFSYKGEESLRNRIGPYHRHDGRPDCVVPLSGGRDSSYVLLSMVRDFGMNPLAVHYANPFSDPQAEANVREACRILNVPLIILPYSAENHRRVFRHNLKVWLKRPFPGMLPIVCMPCRTLWWGILKVARDHHIPLIISGNNRYEDTAFKKALLGISPGETWENTYAKSFKGVAREMMHNLAYLNPRHFKMILKAYFFGDTYATGMRWFARKIHILDLFYYLPWQEEVVVGRIRDEINWKVPPDAPSTWRWDCDVAFLKDHLYTNMIGVTEKDDFYAKLVREGQIDLETARERLQREKQVPMKRIENVLAEAGFGVEEFMGKLEKNYRKLLHRRSHRFHLFPRRRTVPR